MNEDSDEKKPDETKDSERLAQVDAAVIEATRKRAQAVLDDVVQASVDDLVRRSKVVGYVGAVPWVAMASTAISVLRQIATQGAHDRKAYVMGNHELATRLDAVQAMVRAFDLAEGAGIVAATKMPKLTVVTPRLR